MLFEPARHEPLLPLAWDESRARAAIAHVVRDSEARYSPQGFWPIHPLDLEAGDDPAAPAMPLYDGACGVIWTLHHLDAIGAARLARRYDDALVAAMARNRARLASRGPSANASYLMGALPFLLQAFERAPHADAANELAALIAANIDNPTRELMWGAPGTLLAAWFLHERTHDARWAELYRTTADALWDALEPSAAYGCRYWTQQLDGYASSYLGAVHGFAGTALPILRGRALLDPARFAGWQACIADTMERSATREGDLANWRPMLDEPPGQRKMLMQYCHGAPGIVVCLADHPGPALDSLLVAAGEAIWHAGPLAKGPNLCHGTAGNGYAFLALYGRTGEARWLARARAFAMHAIAQMEAEERRATRLRYSLWTGDLGLAVYLWDCVEGKARFPTVEVFFGR
jgi:Lanthionine synthetase C-like protein